MTRTFFKVFAFNNQSDLCVVTLNIFDERTRERSLKISDYLENVQIFKKIFWSIIQYGSGMPKARQPGIDAKDPGSRQ